MHTIQRRVVTCVVFVSRQMPEQTVVTATGLCSRPMFVASSHRLSASLRLSTGHRLLELQTSFDISVDLTSRQRLRPPKTLTSNTYSLHLCLSPMIVSQVSTMYLYLANTLCYYSTLLCHDLSLHKFSLCHLRVTPACERKAQTLTSFFIPVVSDATLLHLAFYSIHPMQ
jgi:hypothetical protein